MPALIPGFEYDIFVSYRHNDNKTLAPKKADGWVSEFVANLSMELEATVKGKVSIYFDENPHDGLLETQNVDESLLPKLKSLIFIPIISQTYCDPHSFAWRHELQAYGRMAASDKLGPSVKLMNGNVSNRILPVRIHEIDSADVRILEEELKGKLRSIDFIFKSPGVNRPLRPAEDDPLKNANRTLYRDQINKVANAVRDIILALKNTENIATTGPGPARLRPEGALLSGKGKVSGIKSVAVLPFLNLIKDPEQEYLGEGLAEEFWNGLAILRELKLVSRSSSFQHKGANASQREVSQKLGAVYLVEGVVQQNAGKVELTVKLTNVEKSIALWSDQSGISSTEIFALRKRMTQAIAEKLAISVKDAEHKAIDKEPTDGRAYQFYMKGRFLLNKQGEHLVKSITHFQSAIDIDPQFAVALAGMAKAYMLLGYYSLVEFEEAVTKSEEAALKALQIDPSLTDAYAALAFISMGYEWNWTEAELCFSKIFAINPGNSSANERYKLYLGQIKGSLEEAKLEPMTTVPHFLQAYAQLHRGQFDAALQSAQKAVDHDPDSFMAKRALGLSYLGREDYDRAIDALLDASRLSNRHGWLLFELMGAYMMSGRIEEARAILEEALAQSNAIPARIFNNFFPFHE